MKLSLVTFALILGASALNAATITIGGSAAVRAAVQNSAGTVTTDFFITLGNFGGATPVVVNTDQGRKDVLDTFVAATFGTPTPAVVTQPGFVSGAETILGGSFQVTGPSSLSGQAIWILVTNNSNITQATQAGFFLTTVNFPNPVSGAGSATITPSVANLTPLANFGSEVDSPTGRDFVRMANVIPEPSTAALGLLAGLGLVARRRRA